MNFLRNLIQGSHSANKAESDHKKKGGVPPPGSADPPIKLEEEAEAQRVTTEPLPECINGANPPVSPSSPLSDATPQSLGKDCETPSTTEETSFASCLTEDPNSLSENGPTSAETLGTPSTNRIVKNPDLLEQSDSEYESAEELDSPPNFGAVVTQQPSSENRIPAPAGAVSSAAASYRPNCDSQSNLDSTSDEISPVNSHPSVENGCNKAVNILGDFSDGKAREKSNNVSESLLTITKNEVIEESVSQKTIIHQEITQLVSDHLLTNGEVTAVCLETVGDPIPERESGELSQTLSGVEPISTNLNHANSTTGNEVESKLECFENGLNTSKVIDTASVNTNESSSQLTNVRNEVNDNHLDSSCSPKSLEHTEVVNSESKTFADSHLSDAALAYKNETSENSLSDAALGDKDQTSEHNDVTELTEPEATGQPKNYSVEEEGLPVPPTKGYSLDFLDNLDDPNFNPFTTKTAVRNTPPPSPEASRRLPPLKPAVKKKKDKKEGQTIISTFNENRSAPEGVSETEATVENRLQKEAELKPKDDFASPEDVEVTFEETTSPRKTPPKLNRKSVPNKKPVRRPTSKPKILEKNNNTLENESVNGTDHKLDADDELPIPPAKGYNLDFLDSLDDPNYNPFATKSSVSNSPPKEGFVVPNDQEIKPKAKVTLAKKGPARKGFTVLKNKAKISAEKQHKELETVETSSDKPQEEELSVPPTKGYNLDYLDDPNFDPFQTRSSVNGNSVGIDLESSNPPTEVNGSHCTDTKQSKEDSFEKLNTKKIGCVDDITSEDDCGVTASKDSSDSDVVLNEVSPKSSEEAGEQEKFDRFQNTDESENLSSLSSTHHSVESEKSELDSLGTEESKTLENGGKEVKVENSEVESLVELAHEKENHRESHLNQENYCDSDVNLPKVPSIGTIGQLDSLEFAQLLGDEASRIAEEFMNCSTDSGLPDSADSVYLDSSVSNSDMANKDLRMSAHLDENVNPFQKNSKLQRSPPLGRRDACGAEGGDANDNFDLFKPIRNLVRESVMGEERLDTSSVEDDSGIALGTRTDLETDINHSEAGPEIATGLTSSDIQCASQ
ncbi:hypothetical protein SK128_022754, partial [Halocaridina rubra]